MGHDPAELETRLRRCERTLFGDDDSSKGLSSRMHMTETTLQKIDAALTKLNWLMITVVVVGILNFVINKPAASSAPTQSTSVITGDATDTTAELATSRTYLTTTDVAKREGVSIREVTDMIQSGEIAPPPVKDGREWRIAADYRILPHDAASCGELPQ